MLICHGNSIPCESQKLKKVLPFNLKTFQNIFVKLARNGIISFMIKRQRFFLVVGDTLAILAAFAVMAVVRSSIGRESLPFSELVVPFLALLALWLIILFIFNLYEIKYINPNPRTLGLLSIAMATNIALGSLMFYLFPAGGITPKLSLLFAGAFAFIFLVAWRRFFYLFFTSSSTRRMFVIGTSLEILQFLKEVSSNPLLGKVLFVTDGLNKEKIYTAEKEFGRPDIIVSETREIEQLTHIAQMLSARVLSIEEAYEELFAKIPIRLFSERMAMQILSREIGFGYFLLKKFLDKIVAILILVMTSPISLLIIFATLIETGRPIILRNKRVGTNRKVFYLYKFRSMKVLNKDGSAEKDGVAAWAEINDPRITRVGRITRKLHIDEIPQMWNILCGDLTLVGPRAERPEFVSELEKEIPFYYLRHTIKPGFTGWAQIKFHYARTVKESEEKFSYDLYYIKNRNLFLDIGIILKTIQIIFTH